MESTVIEIKLGHSLTREEIDHINEAKRKIWKTPPLEEEQKSELFILVKNARSNVVAHGQLITVSGVLFNDEKFTIIGFGGIISNVRNKVLEDFSWKQLLII